MSAFGFAIDIGISFVVEQLAVLQVCVVKEVVFSDRDPVQNGFVGELSA